jgi:hypothetical protein
VIGSSIPVCPRPGISLGFPSCVGDRLSSHGLGNGAVRGRLPGSLAAANRHLRQPGLGVRKYYVRYRLKFAYALGWVSTGATVQMLSDFEVALGLVMDRLCRDPFSRSFLWISLQRPPETIFCGIENRDPFSPVTLKPGSATDQSLIYVSSVLVLCSANLLLVLKSYMGQLGILIQCRDREKSGLCFARPSPVVSKPNLDKFVFSKS